MTRPFIACHKKDLGLLFKVTRIVYIFTFGTFEGGTNFHLRVWKIFIRCIDIPSVEDLPNIPQPGQFDLCQGHSSNRHFQWKPMGFHLNRYLLLRPLGLGIPYQTCAHLRRILQGRPRIRSLCPHFLILWVKVEFFHYN